MPSSGTITTKSISPYGPVRLRASPSECSTVQFLAAGSRSSFSNTRRSEAGASSSIHLGIILAMDAVSEVTRAVAGRWPNP